MLVHKTPDERSKSYNIIVPGIIVCLVARKAACCAEKACEGRG